MAMWRDWPTIEEQRTAMGTTDRPTYDAHPRKPLDAPALRTPLPTARIAVDALPPRTRANYTQGANGQWRGEFTVEHFDLDPLVPEQAAALAESYEVEARIVLTRLAALNGTGGACDDRR